MTHDAAGLKKRKKRSTQRSLPLPLPPIAGLEDYVPDTTRWRDPMLTLFASVEVLTDGADLRRGARRKGVSTPPPPPPWLAAFPLHILVRWVVSGEYPQKLQIGYQEIIDLAWAAAARNASIDLKQARGAAAGAISVAADDALALLSKLKSPPWSFDEVIAAALFSGWYLDLRQVPEVDCWSGGVFDDPVRSFIAAACESARRLTGSPKAVAEPEVGECFQRSEAPGILLARFLRGRTSDRITEVGYIPAGRLRYYDQTADVVVRAAIAGHRFNWAQFVLEQHRAAWRWRGDIALPEPFSALASGGEACPGA